MIFLVRVVISISLCLLSAQLLAAQNLSDKSEKPEETKPSSNKRFINFQISSPHKSNTYSCNLVSYSNQCREYEILASAKDTLDELTDGCESMGGKFQKVDCPDENYLASCVDIVRNYHRPDVIYNNLYYSGKPTQWNLESVERVCGDLGGEIE